jgi:hypothetical protein
MFSPPDEVLNSETKEEGSSDDDSTDGSEEEDEEAPSTVIVISITNKKTERNELFRVLLDTGTNRCMGTRAAVLCAGLKIKQGTKHRYRTAAGVFTTTQKSKIRTH